jgi:hypothetical protein
MILVGKAGQGVVGLWLQIDRLDPPLGLRGQLRHPAPIQQIGNKAGNEHRLARPRQSGDADAGNRLQIAPRDRGKGIFKATGKRGQGQRLSVRPQHKKHAPDLVGGMDRRAGFG